MRSFNTLGLNFVCTLTEVDVEGEGLNRNLNFEWDF